MKKISIFIVILILVLFQDIKADAATGFVNTTACGAEISLAIKRDGSLWLTKNKVFAKIDDNVIDISAGCRHYVYLKSDGSLFEYDYDNGIKKIMNDVVAVSAGSNHTMAIKTDGSLWGWGPSGTLGIGSDHMTIPEVTTPLKIMDNVSFVSAGNDYTMVIKRDGSLWGWGNNKSGQLGIGNNNGYPFSPDDELSPVKVMDNVAFVSASVWTGNVDHTLAIKTDGSLWAWGSNHWGEIGDGKIGTENYRYVPVKIMEDVVNVASANGFSMAVKADGSLWSWGRYVHGTLGYIITRNPGSGSQQVSTITPAKIMENVVEISANTYHSVAVKSDGSLWAWGVNDSGQLGDGTYEDGYIPIKIMEGVALPSQNILFVNSVTPSSWAQEEVNKAISKGLVPDDMRMFYTNNITRSEFCSLAMNLICVKRGITVDVLLGQRGLDINTSAFTDTTDNNILAANALGLVGGKGNGIFDPEGNITRQEAALMLKNTAAVLGKTGVAGNATVFSDSNDIASWAKDGVAFVSGLTDSTSGSTVMGSTGNNCFSPLGSYTREQTCVTLVRLFGAL